jgi:hypothetical protein
VTVLGCNEVRLNEVGAQLDGERVAFQGVIGQVSRRAPVTNDKGPRLLLLFRIGHGRHRRDDKNDQRKQALRRSLDELWPRP